MGFYFMPAATSTKKRTKTKTTTNTSSSFSILAASQHQHNYTDQNRYFLHRPYRHRWSFFLSTLVTLLLPLMLQQGVVVQAKSVENIKVTDSGIRPLKSGDTAIVFYANVSHTGKEDNFPIAARLEMEKCCLVVDSNKTKDCEAMKLISGLGIVLEPNDTKPLQMYFVNQDLYDREGSCALHLLLKRVEKKSKDKSAVPSVDSRSTVRWQLGEKFSINFKTVLPQPNIFRKLFSGSSKGYRICNSDNYNALRECSNYDDCLIRYAGDRSLYNKSSQECEPTPSCTDGQHQFLSVVTRHCEKSHDIAHVHKSFSHDMIHVDALGLPTSEDEHSKHLSNLLNRRTGGMQRPQNLICEHGYHITGNNGRPNCTCHDGWRSLTLQEWKDKGGIMDSSPNDGLPFHKMCTVPLMSQKTRGYLLLGFIGICILIPFVAMLIYNRSKTRDDIEKKSKSEILLEEGAPSSSSSTEEDDNDDEETGLKCKTQSVCKILPTEMEDEEAKRVISEITNRREPSVSNKPSKKDDNDDGGPDLPPAPSNAVSGAKSEASQQQQQQQQSGTSRTNWAIPWNASDGEPTQMPMPPPHVKRSKQSLPPKAAPSSKPSSGGVSTNTKQQMRYFTPSGGFDYGEETEEEDEYDVITSEVNLNSLMRRVLTQTPSMDDLLTMSKKEKSGAHLPMKPKTKQDKGVSVVMANCATVELIDNDVILHSMSSEEMTQRKKEEWAQFIESVSKENFNFRPGYFPVKGIHRIEEEDEDEEETEVYRKRSPPLADFQYFNNDLKSKALKVRSVPGMMQYHPFSSMAAPASEFSGERREENRNDVSIEPPPQSIQKAFGNMAADEQTKRQECYRVLSSLSRERMPLSQEGNLKGVNSIWSNIASENTKELSITPATITAEGSRVTSSIEQPGVADIYEDEMSLRTKTIYGDMGSDNDSDGALEYIAQRSSPRPSTSRQASHQGHPCYHVDKQVKREFVVAEEEGVNNRTVYGYQPSPVSAPPPMVPQTEALDRDARNGNNNDPNWNALINLNILESDFIPSDAYLSSNSANSSRIASRSESLTTGFWKIIATHSLGGQASEIDPTRSDEYVNEGEMSPETNSAYRVKSSLEIALKAGRSRSKTTLFSN